MKLNQRGGALVTALLVIVVFSVLGFAAMGNVVSENKRTHTTESNMQARYLAESGLTYFEKDFNKFFDNNLSSITTYSFNNYLENNFLKNNTVENKNYTTGVKVNNDSEEIIVTAELFETNIKKVTSDGNANATDKMIKVTSTASVNSSTETLISYYQPFLLKDIDGPTYKIRKYKEKGIEIDFSDYGVLQLGLPILLTTDLLTVDGFDENFHRVPADEFIKVTTLGPVLYLNLFANFNTMENTPVVATRQGEVLEAELLHLGRRPLVEIDVLKYTSEDATNVLIDGGYTIGSLLGITGNGYKDIDFKKLAVTGNAVIQQDRYGWAGVSDRNLRRFTFKNGLFVKKSLLIGGSKGGKSSLQLRGNMVAMNNLVIDDVNLQFGDHDDNEGNLTKRWFAADEYTPYLTPEEYISNLYVHGDTTITNTACISLKEITSNKDYNKNKYDFRLFSKGKLNLRNNTSCSNYKGLFYAEKGIYIVTYGQKMTIKGGLIGDVYIYDGIPSPEQVKGEKPIPYVPIEKYNGLNLEYIMDSNYFQVEKPVGVKLTPKGRSFK